MIEISLSAAITLYSIVLGAAVAFIWIYTEIVSRRAYQLHRKQFLWRCVFCGYVYLDEQAQRLSQCPRCLSYSSAQDEHARYLSSLVPSPAAESPEDSQPGGSSRRKRPHQRRRGPRRRK